MTPTDSRYERLDAIERALAHSVDGLTTGELAQMFMVDPGTIRRDLNLLGERGTILNKQGRRHVIDHRRSLYTVKMNNHELVALYLAARLLSRHSDEHNPHVVHALEKLADALDQKSPSIARHIYQAAIAVSARRVRRDYVEALEVVTQGWIAQRKIRLRYRSYLKDEKTERLVSVYFLEPSGIGYASYAIGYDDLRDSLRTFKIERILEARLTDEPYTIPTDFDPQTLLASAWGVIWRDKDDIEVILRFAPSIARLIKESVWHHTQRIEDLPDGSCLFMVRIGSTFEFKPWVLQWGSSVEVIKPNAFREEIAAELCAAAQRYGSVASDRIVNDEQMELGG